MNTSYSILEIGRWSFRKALDKLMLEAQADGQSFNEFYRLARLLLPWTTYRRSDMLEDWQKALQECSPSRCPSRSGTES